MARKPLRPLIRSGGFYPSRKWTPLVYAGGYTTANGGGEPEPPPIEKTITGNPIHILDALAKPAQALSVKLEPVQDLHGYDSPWPAGGGKNLFDESTIYHGYYAPDIIDRMISDEAYRTCVLTLPAGTYTFSCDMANIFILRYAIGEQNTSVTSEQSTVTFTVPSEAVVKICFRNTGTTAITGTFHTQIESGSTATSYTPYSNICPISGWTGANVYHSGADTSDATTYSITFPAAAGTVYGGTLDVTTGNLTVNWAKIVLNGTQQISRENWKPQTKSVGWIYPYGLTRNIVGTGAVLQNIKCDTLPSMPFNSLQSINGPGIALASNQTYGISVMYPNTTLTTASAINAFLAEHPIDVVYELATPQTYQLTPTEVTLLLGENNIWSDGEMTLTYLADGNASDEEALNILFGGRYVNNHSEDEPTDREALNIILGGNER